MAYRVFSYLLALGLFSINACTKCPTNQQPRELEKTPGSLSLSTGFEQDQGWNIDALNSIHDYAQSIGTSALIILHNGKLVSEWGDTSVKYNSHSVRKSLLNALYGVSTQKGLLDIRQSLFDIHLNDEAPTLNAIERTATIRHLLMSRSGIYHKAAYESPSAKQQRPNRGQYQPGTHWYYNNWDFNALGTVFEQQVGLSIGQAFEAWIAQPIGMQDFSRDDVEYVYEKVSQHPAYPFWISTRDLARFGLLYLQSGSWDQQQILTNNWIQESTEAYSQTSNVYHDTQFNYGYLWWVTPEGAYEAHGTGQQVLHINPGKGIVISHRVDTCHLAETAWPNGAELRQLIDKVLNAVPS